MGRLLYLLGKTVVRSYKETTIYREGVVSRMVLAHTQRA